jgi:hypothetical protein
VRPSLADVLSAVAELERDTSLRNAAAQIGLSPTTVRKALDTKGEAMHYRSRMKLYDWYEKHVLATSADELDRMRAAMESLLSPTHGGGVPARVLLELLADIERLHRAGGAYSPPWIGTLRTRLRSEG